MMSKLTRRYFLRAGATVAAVPALAALAGCGEEEAAAPAAPAATAAPVATAAAEKPKAEKVSLEVWHQLIEISEPAWAKIFEAYQAANPNVTIVPAAVPHSDAQAKILTALAGGTEPDLVYVHPETNATLAEKGALAALEPFIKADKSFDFDDFFEGTVGFYQWKGVTYALPQYSGPLILVYNRDLVEPLGLGDPWEMYQKGEWTLDAYWKMAEAGTTGEGENKIYGIREVPGALKIFCCWIWGFGGKVWNDAITETLMAEPKAIEAWEYMASEVHAGFTPSREFAKSAAGGVEGIFLGGRMVIYMASRWTTTKIPEDFNAGTVPMFSFPYGEFNRDGPNALGIFGKSKKQDQAWDLLNYITTKGVEELIAVGFTAPTLKSLSNSEVWLNSVMPWDNAEVHKLAAEQVKGMVHPPRYSEINKDHVLAAWDEVVLGNKDAKDVFSGIKPHIDKILQEGI